MEEVQGGDGPLAESRGGALVGVLEGNGSLIGVQGRLASMGYIYDKQIILKIICTLVQDPPNTIYTFEETQNTKH